MHDKFKCVCIGNDTTTKEPAGMYKNNCQNNQLVDHNQSKAASDESRTFLCLTRRVVPNVLYQSQPHSKGVVLKRLHQKYLHRRF